MKFLIIFALFAVFMFTAEAHHEEHNYDHGTSHVRISHHHGNKFDYHIKHGKHGHAFGSSHPHGYGGFGDSGQ
ncbi:hypothetical protein O3M35_003251 [Rhynocoris fuscipes]|uniref:Uncharacterized protein n=1 Tax=Rhynocoris fuscipes TaxID=488301 RepID=A0AAW1CJH0_9HEMI